MNESRRDFLMGLLLSSVLPSTISLAQERNQPLIIPAFKGRKFWLFDWSRYSVKEIGIPAGPMHSALEISPGRLLFLEFWGNSICTFDLKSKKTIKIELAENEFFNGHGVLTPDRRFLLTVQQEQTARRLDRISRIVVRDPATLQQKKVLYSSTNGTFHDLMFFGSRLVVSEGTNFEAADAKMLFFDWPKSLHGTPQPREIKLSGIGGVSNHFLPLGGGRFLSVPAAQEVLPDAAVDKILANEKSYIDRFNELSKIAKYTPTPIFIFKADGSYEKLWSEKEQESLVHNLSSCAIPGSDGSSLALTHMEGRSITIWKKNELIKRIVWDGPGLPAGIAYSKRMNQILAIDNAGEMRFYSAFSFEELRERRIKLDDGSSHLLTLS